MATKNQQVFPCVVVRKESDGVWSIALPHAERPADHFITFAKDEEEAVWLAARLRQGMEVQLVD
ncbi:MULTISPECIES: hypothetical protein [Caballeronia]|uniref:Uncharacterized protein n=1 Tax=Caballeronia jiangsuensis TaxID=1458357 RepID=A0ABW9CE80_9BURK|nr:MULTISPECIES: hypothetical protein [Caballeronia]GJH12683.1 hypothetical protein CBA19CS11_27615 [Caballeronia novacaledonica]